MNDIQKAARPVAMIVLCATLCTMAMFEQTGMGEAPRWFMGPGAGIFFEWIGEWVVYWRKQGAI